MRHLLNIILGIVALTVLTGAAADPWDNYDEAVFMDMDLDENIATPALEGSEKQYVRTYMRGLASELAKKNYTIDLERDDEVVVITIPTDNIFLPNDTLLSPRYGRTLNPLLGYLKDPGLFKVVYAVHTDNTGSEIYNQELSQERVNTIYDWLLDNVSEDLVIIPFAMGDTDPIEDNITRAGRAANRRLEIYLIPGPDLILQARR